MRTWLAFFLHMRHTLCEPWTLTCAVRELGTSWSSCSTKRNLHALVFYVIAQHHHQWKLGMWDHRHSESKSLQHRCSWTFLHAEPFHQLWHWWKYMILTRTPLCFICHRFERHSTSYISNHLHNTHFKLSGRLFCQSFQWPECIPSYHFQKTHSHHAGSWVRGNYSFF